MPPRDPPATRRHPPRWSRRIAPTLLLLTTMPSCATHERVRSEPVDLSGAAAAPAETEVTAKEAAPRVEWSGIAPERRREVLDVLESSFCPACLCAESVAQCLTPEEPCGCPRCAKVMARFILDAFRQGLSADEVLDLSAEAWVDAFERAPVSFPLEAQPVRRSVSGSLAQRRDVGTSPPPVATDPRAATAEDPIQIVEFADFTCPHCATVAPILEALVESQPDLELTFFFYPLRSAGPSLLAAQAAAEAFEQGQFWSYALAVYDQPRPPGRDDLVAIGQQIGLDAERLAAALDDERHRDAVLADKALGQSVGIRGTPAIYIEGRPFVLPRTLDNLEIWVDMERTRRQCAPGAN